jgi:ubiquinone/menaquinone biosynthesis C-methylase UbiE
MSKMSTFYDIHADDFSKSRFRIWPHVQTFLDSLKTNSRVLDIGCGNGKNILYRDDLDMIGLEYSQGLCNICKSRLLPVVQGDARNVPFEDNMFDAIIMIAVIHHINPDEHQKVLNEIQRVLRPGGICLITNWAVEQPVRLAQLTAWSSGAASAIRIEVDGDDLWVCNSEGTSRIIATL